MLSFGRTRSPQGGVAGNFRNFSKEAIIEGSSFADALIKSEEDKMRHFSIVALSLYAIFIAPAGADPLFPENVSLEVSWPAGTASAFRPVQDFSGKTYYVDATNGRDTNDGSAQFPLKTIGRALALAAAGDAIVVRAGVYQETVAPPDKNPIPTRARPIVLRADPADGQSVVIDGTGLEPVKEGTLQNGAGISLYRDGAFVLEGFRIQNFSGYGLAVQQCADVVIKNCSFFRNGLSLADAVDMLIISSQQTRVTGCSFDGNNEVERALDDRSTDTWIYLNKFTGYRTAAIHLGPHPQGAGCRIEHNIFLDNPAIQGVLELDQVRGVEVVRNLIKGGDLFAIRIDESENVRVLHNTITGFPEGMELRALTRCRISANILYGNTVGVEALSLLDAGTLAGNLYYANDADIDGQAEDASALHADPAFSDPAAGDFTLSASSPAVDAAPADLEVPRGGGARADLGAFERGAPQPPYEYQPKARVADLTPMISWKFADGDAGRSQATFRIQLDALPTFDSLALIDSNWTPGQEGRWTVPDDFALSPAIWYVRVKLQNDQGRQGPWSPPRAAFEVVAPAACASQGGKSCAELDACSGEWLEASDTRRCCRGECRPCPDADGDRHLDSACGGDDCNDADKNIYPGAVEVCDDQIDNDCDGDTDLDDSGCGCIDRDRDGYGVNCPAGLDCDDTIASVHPDAEELCNNTDDDCDGATDEGYEIARDPENCGECGFACRPQEVCDLGQCLTACRGGRTSCDRSCLDISSDMQNCGGCGKVCAASHATTSCIQGTCQITLCENGYHDLNGLLDDGCEYQCQPAGEGKEICGDNLDNDCDGLTDEDCAGGCGCGAQPESPVFILALALLLLARRGF
jgi:hypothetical protein